jgi:hypothetical protein
MVFDAFPFHTWLGQQQQIRIKVELYFFGIKTKGYVANFPKKNLLVQHQQNEGKQENGKAHSS